MLFDFLFFALCGLYAAIQLAQNRSKTAGSPTTSDFKKFQRLYLVVYFCSVMADWLQGPYVYALYDYYKFTKKEVESDEMSVLACKSEEQIGVLFIVGFGSSAVFGVFAGSFADKYGRKLSCLVYCVTYIVSCLTKHSPNFNVLLFGRLTGGIATSILFSSFESWMVAEHGKHFYPSEWLSQTFSLATVGNGIVAIAAGWLGALVRDSFDRSVASLLFSPHIPIPHSLVAPFDLAIVFLALAMAVIWFTWAENKGESSLASGRYDDNGKVQVMLRRRDVHLCACLHELIEGKQDIDLSCYKVFMWTPKLEPLFKPLPHGQVFGCFMACMVIGSSLVKSITTLRGPPVVFMREVFLLAAVCLGVPAMAGINAYITLFCFFLFELICGVYWPSMATIKSKYVPEEVRATVYNFFRIPLNLIVIFVLSNLGTVSDDSVFLVCAFLLGAAGFLQHIFASMVRERSEGSVETKSENEAMMKDMKQESEDASAA
ncbi:hypothetical protein GUITHDRAFT_161244 [Guillardia theta CCMP2712]|uniref:Molybdate-anion transporter n=1 Tax=Guillardia theta (strain CCMP2712) TaxID=905079 RepID=L1JWD2_GUITC|nr:hypothetical protein GUITHDRAFT_161244 [Guillardia theta CCMP2712]EKX52644.1 hypothetical protein GUITHDRAFT_161244 [Guillardia theta CCMP2712]|eukprot:XP_005839624.1 hypothetical protein GUITHDRAFT_161244 [Guillardia theta CCMP2712]